MEDDHSVRTALVRLLKAAGFDVAAFGSAEAFLAGTIRYGCVIVDVQLPGLSGLDLAECLRAHSDQTPMVFMTGRGEALSSEVARRTGRCCLDKPIDETQLLLAIARALLPAD